MYNFFSTSFKNYMEIYISICRIQITKTRNSGRLSANAFALSSFLLYIYIYTHIQTHICICVCVYTCVCRCVCVCIRVCVRVCVCVCLYVNIVLCKYTFLKLPGVPSPLMASWCTFLFPSTPSRLRGSPLVHRCWPSPPESSAKPR